MLAVTFQGVEQVSAREVPNPRIRPGDVIVEVRASGLCGSDLHPYFGRERGLDIGTIMGHELVGVVAEAGPRVTRFRAGDRVVAPFSTCCGECGPCRRRLNSRCRRGQLFGWVEGGVGLHGVQAEYARVPLADATLVGIPGEVDNVLAVLAADILPTARFAVDLAEVRAGDALAVLGCGPVGLLACFVATARGVRVAAFDPEPQRAARAMDFGAADSASPGQVPGARGGGDFAAVVDAAGTAEASQLAVSLLRPGGVLAAVAVNTDTHLPFSPSEMYDLNLTYRTGRCPARSHMEWALELLAADAGLLASLISHRLGLEQAGRAYSAFGSRREGWMKVVFVP